MADPAILQARLEEAEAALHQLTIGAREVSISYDGKSVSYAPADEAKLRAYILDLKSQLGLRLRRSFSPFYFG